jgi:hypothetical protein
MQTTLGIKTNQSRQNYDFVHRNLNPERITCLSIVKAYMFIDQKELTFGS